MEFFTGTVLLLLFLAAMAGVGIWVSYEESIFWAAVTWIVGIGVLHYAFGISILSVVGVLGALGILLAYVFAGGLYTAFILWPRWLRSKEDDIVRHYKLWESRNPDGAMNFYDSSEFLLPYSASQNKQRLATWTMMWLFNAIWDITHRPIIWVYEKAYHSFGRLFDRLGKQTVSRILNK
jgi:hypothetical protein